VDGQRCLGAPSVHQRRQPFHVFERHNWIEFSRGDEGSPADQAPHRRLRQRHHRPEQNGRRKRLRPKQHGGGGDIRPVGIPEGRHAIRREAVVQRSGCDEICELMRAADHVSFIEDTFCDTPEEARLSVLGHIATRAQQSCV